MEYKIDFKLESNRLKMLEKFKKDQGIRVATGDAREFLKKTPKSVKHMLVYLDTLLEYMDLLDNDWECITLGHLNMLSYIANNAYGEKYFLDVFEIGDEDYLGISYKKVREYIESVKKHIEDWEEKENGE